MMKKAKKIGRYLLDNQSCDREALKDALSRQSSLESLGEYKTIGQIMLERGAVAREALHKGLKQQWFDMLAAAELFQSLSFKQVDQIAQVAEDRTLSKDRLLFSQGDPGETYWLVISGGVRVYRRTEDGIEVELARFQPGDGFGEMSLLTGEPRSASVATVQASRFLVIHKNDFDRVVEASPELSVAFAKILAERLSQGNISLEKASATERAYQRFVSEYQAGPQLDLVGRSRLLEKMRKQARLYACNTDPVLLAGPPGSEKKQVSWYIHKESNSADNPYLFVDLNNLKHIFKQEKKRSEPDPLQMELAQDSTLFGHVRGALPFARANRLGLLQVGNGGTVVIDHIESLAASMQEKLLEFLRSGRFKPLGNGEDIRSSLRIICCTAADLEDLTEEGLFNRELYELLGGQTLEIPPLKRRKKDLGLLVDYLVEHYSREFDKKITIIDQKAYGEIMAYDWPGNMDELEVVIRRAVNLVSYGKLAPENLFIGLSPAIGKFTFNILQFHKVKRFFASVWYPGALQFLSGAFFLYIFYLGFWGRQQPEDNVSLALTWGLWEPAVIISTIFAARIWCGICPVGAISSLCSRNFGAGLSVPHFLRKYGFYLSGIGLGIIMFSEVAFDMTGSPLATAVLIAAITIPAIILGLLFQRRTWCRYLCPLGKMLGVFASGSMLELRANYGICNNDCLTHNCYTGDKECQNGCPMFEGPFSLRSNLECTMCGNCIKNCPNQSPQVNLRLPGFELWSSRRFEKTLIFLIPIIMGTQIFRGLEKAGFLQLISGHNSNDALRLGILLTFIIILVFGAVKTAESFMLRDSSEKIPNPAGVLSYGILLLVLSFEVGFQAERILLMGGQLLPVLGHQFGFDWEFLGMGSPGWVIKMLQIMLVLLGSWGSSMVLRGLYPEGKSEAENLPFSWRLPLLTITLFYLWLFIAG